jgi:20S proteasome alpha/beta subunit
MMPKPHKKLFSLPKKRLPWRRGAVTVCIGAICEDHIITVSDTKLSTGYYSTDLGSLKIEEVHYLWRVMIAGKFSQSKPMLDRLGWELVACGKEELLLQDVVAACVRVYKDYAVQLAEESVLAPFGISMPDFLKSRGQLGDALYERVWGDISRVQVGCEFLVGGYCNGVPHLFTVNNPTPEHPSFTTYYDEPGFAAIGSGSILADSVMYAFEHRSEASFIDTIYRATYAKFGAESATDVGELTFVCALDKEGEWIEFDPRMAIELRDQYLARRDRMVPSEAADTIHRGMESARIKDARFTKAIFQAASKRYKELSEKETGGSAPKPSDSQTSKDQQ